MGSNTQTVGSSLSTGVSAPNRPSEIPGLYPSQKYVTGQWYGQCISTSGLYTSPLDNYLIMVPYKVDSPFRIQAIALNIQTAGQSGSLLRLGIYDDLNGQPNNVLLDAGTLPSDTNGEKVFSVSYQFPVPGWYYLAGVCQNNPTTRPTCYGFTSFIVPGGPVVPAGNIGGSWHANNAVSGPLPNRPFPMAVHDQPYAIVVQAA